MATSPSPATQPSAAHPPFLFPALGLNVLIASGTFLVAKQTLHDFPPLTLAMLRFVLAAAVLWPVTRWLRPGQRVVPEDRGRVWMLGLLGVPLNQGIFLVAMQWASASHAALLYALTPTFVVLFVWLGGGPRPILREFFGIVLAFAGVTLLLLERGLHFDPDSLKGDLLIILAVIAWALYLALGREVMKRNGSLVVTADSLVRGTVLFLPIGLVALWSFEPASVTPGGWTGLLYLAWLTSALNYVIWFWGLKYLAPGTVALLTNLQPIVTAGLAWAFLKESLPPGFAFSAALVLGGVWITQRAALARRFRSTGGPPAA